MMEIWIFIIWAIIVFILAYIHLYKFNLSFYGYVFLLLAQILFLSIPFKEEISRGNTLSLFFKINGLSIVYAVLMESLFTIALFLNSVLELVLVSFKEKTKVISRVLFILVLLTVYFTIY